MRKLKLVVASSAGQGKTLLAVYLEKMLQDAGITVKLIPNRDGRSRTRQN